MFLGIWLCQGFLVRQLQVSLMLGAILVILRVLTESSRDVCELSIQPYQGVQC